MYSKIKSLNMLTQTQWRDEQSALLQLSPAFNIKGQEMQSSPLIYASGHSGRIYPKAWLKHCAASEATLRLTEDAYVDALFENAPQFGAPLLRANFPRSFVDVNRSADELPQGWDGAQDISSARGRAGLGVVPLAIAQDRPIYKTAPSSKIGQARLRALYHPYHDALQNLISQTKAQFAHAILIDCHSMPGFGPLNKRRSDFILGDRYGKSCAPELIDSIGAHLSGLGYSVTRNYPYAGGYVTSHYGCPSEDVQAIQIEINRDLYISANNARKKPGFAPLQDSLDSLMAMLQTHYGRSAALAAE